MDPNVAIDYQIESQRGWFVCGVPIFTANWLFPWDPYPYTDLEGNATGRELRQMQVPNPEWEWDWSNWVIDMTGQVDYHGWSYNFWFTRKHWHDGSMLCRNFVRQRRWMRQRKKVVKPGVESDHMIDALDMLAECRNDRELTQVLVANINDENINELLSCSSMIISKYQFPQNIEKLKQQLSQTPAGQRFVDSII